MSHTLKAIVFRNSATREDDDGENDDDADDDNDGCDVEMCSR